MTEWVDLPGGRFTLGLLPDEVERLAFASARAARERVDRAPDPLHGLREREHLDGKSGNADFLRKLLVAAFAPREVELADFEIARAPVTNGDWRKFLVAEKLEPPDGWKVAGGDAPERAVIGVSWDEASRYAEWAGASLPLEGEWERAARGESRRMFPWGDAWGTEGAWIDLQPYYDPWPALSHPELASPDGVHDLVTRRWEWCADAFAGDVAALEQLFPALRRDGRVRRGGEHELLVACAVARTGTRASWRADGTGFRLARRR